MELSFQINVKNVICRFGYTTNIYINKTSTNKWSIKGYNKMLIRFLKRKLVNIKLRHFYMCYNHITQCSNPRSRKPHFISCIGYMLCY